MQFATWDLIINFVLLLFWYRLWNSESRLTYFNPYLARLDLIPDAAIRNLRSAFISIPERLVCVIAMTALILLRAMIFHGMAARILIPWTVSLGFEQGIPTSFASAVSFSVLSFAIFLFQVWGLSVIYVHSRPRMTRGHATETLSHLARPFTDIEPRVRPLVLLAAGALLAMTVHLVLAGAGQPNAFGANSPWVTGFRMLLSGILGWVNLLLFIRIALVVLIVASWIGMFAHVGFLQFLCHEWLDLLMGPLRRFPMRVGMFDLTPIILFFLIDFIHPKLLEILTAAYTKLEQLP